MSTNPDFARMVRVYHTEEEEFCHFRRDGVGGEEPWDVHEWSASLPPERRHRLIEFIKSLLEMPDERIVELVLKIHPDPIMLQFDPKEGLMTCLVSIEGFQDYDYLLDKLEAVPGREQWHFQKQILWGPQTCGAPPSVIPRLRERLLDLAADVVRFEYLIYDHIRAILSIAGSGALDYLPDIVQIESDAMSKGLLPSQVFGLFSHVSSRVDDLPIGLSEKDELLSRVRSEMEVHGPHVVAVLSRALREYTEASREKPPGIELQGLAMTQWSVDLIEAIGGEDLVRLHAEATDKRNRLSNSQEWDSFLDGNDD